MVDPAASRAAGQPHDGADRVPLRDWLLLGTTALASAGLLWGISGQPLIAAGFIGGIGTIGAILRLVVRPAQAEAAPDFAAPDWSVTNAAIERTDCGIAITDRAGRLVCSNALMGECPQLRRVCRWNADRPTRWKTRCAPRGAMVQRGRKGWRPQAGCGLPT